MAITARNHLPVTNQVAEDLVKIIDQAPTGFDLLVFKAQIDDTESTVDMPDPVGNLEAREKTISFADPVVSRAIMLPNDHPGLSLAYGFGELDHMDEPVSIVLKEPNVPEQSVVWFEEQVSADRVKVTLLYVLKSEPVGANGQAGSVHVLMPFAQGIDTLPDVIYDEDGMPTWTPKPLGQGLKDQLAKLVDAVPSDDALDIMREPTPMISMDDDLDEDTLNKQAIAGSRKYSVMADFVHDLKHSDAEMPTDIDLYDHEPQLRKAAQAIADSSVDTPTEVPEKSLDDLLNEETLNNQAIAASENIERVTNLFETLGAIKHDG
ncbi:hypothetical protein [Endozoicomonas lisbonensis]|uniref:Uncharacterized protein n=1 Tax=Endozoicomonas lisbonensis TaxID=3120522 RepID=A0ABV2SR50_9GAMM